MEREADINLIHLISDCSPTDEASQLRYIEHLETNRGIRGNGGTIE